MQEELRARFRTRFIETARGRVRKSVELLSDDNGASTLMTELHSLAGEAALLGLKDISDAARSGELAARDWANGDTSAKLRCVRLVRQVSRCVEAFAAEPVDAPAPDDGADNSDAVRNRRVLVVDDSTLSGEHIADALEDNGLETKLATNPASALLTVEQFSPRMVISDVNMPGVDLADMCSKLRERSKSPLLIILLSGMQEGGLAERARQVNADGYISKQHGIEQVTEHVMNLLRESTH